MGVTLANSKERALHRLKIARGHLTKVIEMIDKDEYCIDIIHQSQAIQNALKEVDHLILENHLNTCVLDQIKRGKAKDTVAEIMRLIKQNK